MPYPCCCGPENPPCDSDATVPKYMTLYVSESANDGCSTCDELVGYTEWICTTRKPIINHAGLWPAWIPNFSHSSCFDSYYLVAALPGTVASVAVQNVGGSLFLVGRGFVTPHPADYFSFSNFGLHGNDGWPTPSCDTGAGDPTILHAVWSGRL